MVAPSNLALKMVGYFHAMSYVCPSPNGTRLPPAAICIVDTLPYIANKYQEHDIEIYISFKSKCKVLRNG